ncbi:MAG: flagellar motor switch protein FliN [Fimbriimonas sp.]
MNELRRPDRFSEEQVRTLQMLHETFARLAGSSLSAYLRAPVSIDLISLEQVLCDEHLRSINNSVFTIVSLPPLSGQAVLTLELRLVTTIVDLMLGGPGKAVSRSVLTDIERPLLRQTIELMLRALKAAWEGVVIVNPSIDAIETSADLVQIASPGDIVVTLLFDVQAGTQRHAMSLCIPYLMLKPFTTKLSVHGSSTSSSRRPKFGIGTAEASNPFVGSGEQSVPIVLMDIPLEVSVELGRTKMLVREVLDLSAGSIIEIDRAAVEPVDVLVNGRLFARGEVVVIEDNFGVRLTETLTPKDWGFEG